MMTTSTKRWALAIVSALAITAIMPAITLAGTMATNQHDFIHRKMGATTPEARSVGSVFVALGEGGLVARGSGVLVGGRYVLTAAHLVDDSNGAATFNLGGQTYGMRRWVVANQFYTDDADDDLLPNDRAFRRGADLALVELDRPVANARNLKAKINRSRNEVGQTATIVGFGRGGNGAIGINTNIGGVPVLGTPLSTDGTMNAGDTTIGSGTWGYLPVKRAGKNVIEPLSAFGSPTESRRELMVDFDPAPNLLNSLQGLTPPSFDPFTQRFNLEEDDVPITNEFMPSVGDSGGGLFINGKLAGITSWTTRANSEFFSEGAFTRLSTGWWRWVRDNKRAFNHARKNGTAARPWNRVANGGNGFKGILKMRAGSQLLDDAGGVILFEDQVFNIFGPGLLFDETATRLTIGTNLDSFNVVFDDLAADPAPLFDIQGGAVVPLPEPTSLALLSLGVLAALRRTRR